MWPFSNDKTRAARQARLETRTQGHTDRVDSRVQGRDTRTDSRVQGRDDRTTTRSQYGSSAGQQLVGDLGKVADAASNAVGEDGVKVAPDYTGLYVLGAAAAALYLLS